MVVGTRPEAIKLAPVAAALSARSIVPLVLFTGQHPALDPADHGLSAHEWVRFYCPGQRDPHAHVAEVTKALVPFLSNAAPALVAVQGDTSSALGAALAARLLSIPVAHIEAGLRSHDRRHPWPEEEFRIAIDSDCDLLFAPTALSAANLRRERARGQVHVTGNSGIDAVMRSRRGTDAVPHSGEKRLLVTCHRRENWGDGIGGVAAALRQVAAEGLARVEVLAHPNPDLARRVRELLLGSDGIAITQPCGHSQTVAAMLRSDLVLSDSGGMQEEAAALGVPLLVLRKRTERPEAIASGNVDLVGTDPKTILAAVRRRLDSPVNAGPSRIFGDGRASERIAAVIECWLEDRGELGPAIPDRRFLAGMQ